MKSYFKILMLGTVVVALAGCGISNSNNAPKEPNDKLTKVDYPPRIFSTDWNVIISPLINDMIKNADIEQDNTILISDAKNNGKGYVSSTQIYNILSKQLSNQDVFKIVDKKEINQAKQYLGIPYDDALVSRSKMIALARHVNANYMIFTNINQTPVAPNIYAEVSIELISTKTGEIVWQLSSEELAKKGAK